MFGISRFNNVIIKCVVISAIKTKSEKHIKLKGKEKPKI